MRISDWSSDVCSSDLARLAGASATENIAEYIAEYVADIVETGAAAPAHARLERGVAVLVVGTALGRVGQHLVGLFGFLELGRATGRERVGQYVWISVGAGSVNRKLKKEL